MGLSGKYDFRGIKKVGAAGLRRALALSPYTSWTLMGGAFTDLILEFLSNWLANNGLLVLNLGAIIVDGHVDFKQLDAAWDKAFEEITAGGGTGKLTAAQKKAIDDEVIKAARKALPMVGSS
jgi:hypothetical protein